jgi:hypothetical protein
MSSIDWVDLAKSQKLVKTKDERSCGNLMAEYKDNIIIIEGVIKSHEYMVPKSNVIHYNENEIYLDIPYDKLSKFEF